MPCVKRAIIFSFCLFLSLSGLPAYADTAQQATQKSPELKARLSAPELIKALKKGGYTVFTRHPLTDQKQIDAPNLSLENCATQRNLSEAGRQQAAFIGKSIKEQRIPVGEVYTSPYCRCKATASLEFGDNSYTVVDDLQFPIRMEEPVRQKRAATLKKLLTTVPAPGKNNFMLCHTGNLKEAINVWPEPEGVMMVFKPVGDGEEVEYIGKITPEDWPGMPATLITGNE